MTTSMTRQPRRPLIRWAMTAPGRVIGILRYLNGELLAAGDAMARSNRFPRPGQQTQAMSASLASASRVLTEV